ncbi:putative LRR receptor-like serine/threonine-protein kinase [Acorus calamus]|uniref:LRR receptor-like serine/threonine-protein kinase n=1 Tax=Acorus calamus TaxID=4465 RepID=A0AAV9CPJ4_ACOCL|nr:putative LRR receptor-like serine/threonine-protein kinase [Acorus calamus]
MKPPQKPLTLLFFVLSFLTKSSALNEASEALFKWKESLEDSHSLDSWSIKSHDETNPCKWVGITCDSSHSVVEINLPHFNLSGTLDDLDFTSLLNLTALNLNGNFLHGPIPSNISALSKLTLLDLGNNGFIGAIPPEIGRLSELIDLRLYSNFLNHTIPYQLGNLKKVQSQMQLVF